MKYVIIALVTILIIYLAIYFWVIILRTKKTWTRWVYESLTFPSVKKILRRNLSEMNETQKILFLLDLLRDDREYWSYWYGRKFRKLIIKELEKLSK